MSSSLSRSTIEVLQLSCSEFLAASCSRRAVTSTIATGGFEEVVAPPDGELPVAPRRREAELPSSTEPRRVGEEPCRAADLGGASCEGRICSVVGGRESFDLRRPSFSRIFPKMLMTTISIVPTFTGSLPRGSYARAHRERRERGIEAAIGHFPNRGRGGQRVRRLLNDLVRFAYGSELASSRTLCRPHWSDPRERRIHCFGDRRRPMRAVAVRTASGRNRRRD